MFYCLNFTTYVPLQFSKFNAFSRNLEKPKQALKKITLTFLSIALCACNSIHPPASENFLAAEINAKLALAYLDKNEFAKGKEKLLLAQKQAPFDPIVWYVGGYFLERTGDNTAADQAYLKSIQLAPHLGAAHNNYGAFLCRQGQYSMAISHFLLAVKDAEYLNTNDAYKNAAQCAMKIPNKALADKYFQLAGRTG